MDSVCLFTPAPLMPMSAGTEEVVALHALPGTLGLSLPHCVTPEAGREVSGMSWSTPTAVVPVPVGKDCLHPSNW